MRNPVQYSRPALTYTVAKCGQCGCKMISGVLYALLAGLMVGIDFLSGR